MHTLHADYCYYLESSLPLPLSSLCSVDASNAKSCMCLCVLDEDVLDTWFSSGIFPFSIFGWPNEVSSRQLITGPFLLLNQRELPFFVTCVCLSLAEQGPECVLSRHSVGDRP